MCPDATTVRAACAATAGPRAGCLVFMGSRQVRARRSRPHCPRPRAAVSAWAAPPSSLNHPGLPSVWPDSARSSCCRNHLFPGWPLPGLGREAGLQGLHQHLRLQRLAAAAGEHSSHGTVVLAAWRGAGAPVLGLSGPAGSCGKRDSHLRGRVLPAAPRSAHRWSV